MPDQTMRFLEAYKELDELCKQILSSTRGVSAYIEEMEKRPQARSVAGWGTDYRRLKELRHIRNKLVHEVGSFEYGYISEEDVEWLRRFRSRILERTDPCACEYRARMEIEERTKRTRAQGSAKPENVPKQEREGGLSLGALIFCAVVFFSIMLRGCGA